MTMYRRFARPKKGGRENEVTVLPAVRGGGSTAYKLQVPNAGKFFITKRSRKTPATENLCVCSYLCISFSSF